MNKLSILLILLFISLSLSGQIWEENLLKKNSNPTTADKFEAFENYRAIHPYRKGNGYKPYAREMDFINKRISDNKSFKPNALYIEWEKEKEKYSNPIQSSVSNWVSMGPINTPIIISNGKKRGNGRVNCIAFDPVDPDIIWIGSPAGGLWKSVDGGSNWTTNTDGLPVIGVSHIAIDPNNNQIMYIVTGDAYATDTYSIGILKSTDGGITWNTTGLSYNVSQEETVNKVIINPNHTDSLYAVTNSNILISVDAGANWLTVGAFGRWRDIEFKPNNSNVIYAAKQSSGGSNIYRTTDGGVNWVIIDNGISGSRYRPLIAVTPDNPEVIYALYSASDYSLHGLYKSSDAGNNWTLQSNSPNILGRDTDGTSTGGQSWYDLSLAVSTNDENLLYVGGINLWKTIDGGQAWTINASSGNGSNYSYMHVDQHAAEFNPLNHVAYAGNDGGFYKYMENLNTWVDISDGLEISQFYNLGLSQSNPNRIVAGAQDNGTEMLTNSTWDAIMGGDGMECKIDHYDDNIIYAEYQYGGIRKTNNGGNNWNNIKPVSYEGGWNTPYEMHSSNNNLIVIGYEEVYRSETAGAIWDSISYNVSGGQALKSIALAPSDEDYIYAATYSSIKVTKDAGATWVNIKPGVPNYNITDITVANNNPDRVWVTLSQYNSSHKIYESIDGGTNWINITATGLPNLPVNCIVYQHSTNDDLYVGTDVGVYYKNNTMTDWVPFMNGLPNVIVNELEIHYAEGTISAATYGRGIWKSLVNTLPAMIGCTDSTALNYDPLATLDDSSCNYCNITNFTSIINPTNLSACDGSAVSNSVSNYPIISYNWFDSQGVSISSSNFAINLCNDTYIIFIIDSVGCQFIDTIIIITPTWDCDGQGNCSDPGTGNGAFTSLSTCQSNCIVVTPTWDCDGLGNCSDPGTGNGAFTSLSACQANCISSNPSDCSELFISEYVEGYGQNKAIEVYNPTSVTIDLSNYQVERYTNGSTNPSSGGITTLTGMLAPGDAFVLTNGETDTSSLFGYIDAVLFSMGDMAEPVGSYPTPMHMNGNDAMVLTKNGVIIDVIGRVGENPGGGWTDDASAGYTDANGGAWWTKNHTLIRKSIVLSGDNDGLDLFNPSLEWDSLSIGTWSNLGSHTCNCFTSTPTWDCINGACIDPGTGNGTYASLTSCQSNCIVVTPTWDCDGLGNCSDPGTGQGTYASLTSCQSNCIVVTPTWDCDGLGNCSDPGNGNGAFTSLSACQSNCIVITPTWDCDGLGNCSDPGTGNGAYATDSACQSNCVVITPTWDCDGQGNCNDPGTGQGTYASLTSCQSNCIVVTPTWDCDGLGNCSDPGNGNGAFTSLSACQSNCVVITPTWDCDGLGNCSDPGTGNGAYATDSACQSNCVVITPTWDCDGQGNCNDPGTGQGTYASLTSCQSNCIVVTPTWDCDGLGNCSDPGNGNGAFTSLSACQSNCVVITPTWDCDVLGNCSDPGNGNGAFTSLSACQSNCIVVTPTWDCDGLGNCSDPGTGNGTYASLTSCQSNCINVSIEEIGLTEFNIFPNPSNDLFNISFVSNRKQDLRLRVINSLAEEVFLIELQQFTGEYTKGIDLSNYATGIYFLEIETNDGIINKKLILQ